MVWVYCFFFISFCLYFFFFNDTATTEIYTLSLHDALPISQGYLIPGIILLKHGITLRDLGSYRFTGSHRNCAKAVISHRFDACGMQDTMGKKLAKEGLLRIIYTSKPYPSSGIAANRDVPSVVLSRVKQALLDFQPKGRDAAGLYNWDKTEMPRGFIEAHDGDYAELRKWAKKLGYIPDINPETVP